MCTSPGRGDECGAPLGRERYDPWARAAVEQRRGWNESDGEVLGEDAQENVQGRRERSQIPLMSSLGSPSVYFFVILARRLPAGCIWLSLDVPWWNWITDVFLFGWISSLYFSGAVAKERNRELREGLRMNESSGDRALKSCKFFRELGFVLRNVGTLRSPNTWKRFVGLSCHSRSVLGATTSSSWSRRAIARSC